MTSHPEFYLARQYALKRLEKELPSYLWYHSIYHTQDDVLPAAERLATLEGISDGDRVLLFTAALYHDLGFTIQVKDHEIISSEIAAQVLPDFGYSRDDILQIRGMILVTKLFTQPKTLLEAILVDSDLDVLGRGDFFKRNDDLRKEILALGVELSDQQWFGQQCKFMHTHCYRTISAQALRNPLKEKNLQLLSSMLDRSIIDQEF